MNINPELVRKINEQEAWTFQEVLGLAADFNMKPRFVIAFILANGKNYIDGEKSE
ncbi:MAG: hypothetical protein VYE04_17295 [Pseudomonadota bacterium]|nr:hypothetical protein [Pseudomonadota bacterium]